MLFFNSVRPPLLFLNQVVYLKLPLQRGFMPYFPFLPKEKPGKNSNTLLVAIPRFSLSY
jgi:hypothetical protein